ncbi:MAG: glycosyltransferase family 4 protein [Chthoniobacteraceae bacterium]|nr:glycosyltransferase family 4 protein [Chthoniobacteraceae bacterium]
MKIVLLTTDNREHQQKYAEPAPRFGTAPEALLQGFSMLPGVEVHVVCCTRRPIQSPEKLADNIWYHSLLVPKTGWITTGYQGCIRAVRSKLREIRPDIVHGQGTERDCAISAVFSGFPNVLTIHGNMRLIAELYNVRPFSYAWLVARLEQFTLPRSLGVICITRYTQRAVRNLARRTWVLPNAVDAHFFEGQPTPGEPPRILVIGVICKRKNQNAFIKALDPLASEKAFKVEFVGSCGTDDYGREFRALISTRPWCEYSGTMDRDTLRQHLPHAAMLALPSLEDNCPMTVLESMAAGIPVIAANVGGVPELFTDKIDGLLCDPENPGSMLAAVRSFLENPEAARRVGLAGRQTALGRYHPRQIALRHVEIYHEALNRAS